jgi:adhesin/invasin
VLVTDSLNNPLSGIAVSFTAPGTGTSANLSATTATTDANGHASVTAVANNVVGSYTVTASVSGVTPSASFALTNLGGSAANLVFTQQPVNTAAGAILAPVQVRLTDNGGNPVSGVTIALSAQGGTGVLSGAAPITTDASGLVTFSNLSIDKAGTYALQATDGIRVTTSSSFLITAGTASSITVLAGSGQSAPIGAPYATPLKASVRDSQGNGVSGIPVTFTAPVSGASVTFAGSSAVITDSTGVAAVSVTANSQVGAFQITATAPGITGQAVFSLININGPASHLSFVQQPADTQAGATLSPMTVQLTDNAGNSIAQAGTAITLLLSPLGARLRTIFGSTTALTNSSGLATFANLSISASGSYQFTATAASFTSAQSNTFRISAGPPSIVQAAGGTPQSTTVLAPFATPLQALVTDSFANPVGGISVVFAAPASGASANLSPSTSVTDGNGRVSVTATANSVVGSYAVTAAAPGITATAGFALTNVAGGGSLLSFAQQPANTPAGSTMAAVVVRLLDSGGNPLSGAPIALALTGAAGSLSGTLSVNTDANGNASFNDLRIDTTGTYQLVASNGGISAPSSLFEIGPAVGRSISVVEGDRQSAASGDVYAIPLKIIVRDGLGNGVPGAQVTFTAPASGATITFTGNSTVAAAADGLATSPIATANGQPGLFAVVASTPGASGVATFNLQNLPATASRMQFTQQPTDTVAGNAVTPAVMVQIVDRFANPVSQAGISINLLLVTTTAGTRSITGATARTNSSGLAAFPNLSVTQSGNYQLLALATGFESATSASFRVTGGAPSSVSASAGTPQSTTVRNVFAQPFVALVTDSAGNPLPGASVTFTAPPSGPSGTFQGGTTSTAISDANGRATSAVFTANSTPGTFSVTAGVTGVGTAAAFTLSNVGPDAPVLAFTRQPSNAAAGGVIAPPVQVQIQDSNGQPVNQSGVAILMTLSQGTGSLSGTLVQVTDGNGVAVFNDLGVSATGVKRLRALGSAQASVESNQFQISAGAAARIVPLSGGGQIVPALAQFPGPLQALVEDALSNPVPGVPVTFTLPASGSSGTFGGPATTQTGTDGIATSPLITANNIQGVISAAASTPNVGSAAQFVIAIIAPSAGLLQVSPSIIQFVQPFGGSSPADQTATIISTSDSAIPWSATSSVPWLAVNPLAGNTPAQITLSVNGAGLAPGQHGGLVSVTDTAGKQQSIFVTFIITAPPTLVAQPSQLVFLSVVPSDLKPRAVPPQTIHLDSANSLVPISYRATAQVQTPAGGNWLLVSPAAGATPGSVTVAVDPTGLQPGIYGGFVIFTPDDTTVSPVSVPVTIVVGCGTSGCVVPAPNLASVNNAANYHIGGSPGGVQALFGSYLAISTQTATTIPLPTSLAGTSVLVNGIAAPLYYVSPSQINFQLPSSTATGSAQIEVVRNGQRSSTQFAVTPVQPGLYLYDNVRAAALNQDLTLHTPQTPIPAGGYVVLYLNGMGLTTPSVPDGQAAPFDPLAILNGRVQATIGGLPAAVSFAGLTPSVVGLIQVNAQIPAGLSPGDQPVFVTVNGVPTNAGLVTVK